MFHKYTLTLVFNNDIQSFKKYIGKVGSNIIFIMLGGHVGS